MIPLHCGVSVKTGYFSVKYGTAADTNQYYLWSKKRVKLFQDSKRKQQKLDETFSPLKVYMCGTG
ncbi:hypothetical protein BAT02nite_34640 [Bacillus atrophaeus]|nr:hypothetical protein BAT02nite_34640 [Bacillus atrophaeus]